MGTFLTFWTMISTDCRQSIDYRLAHGSSLGYNFRAENFYDDGPSHHYQTRGLSVG